MCYVYGGPGIGPWRPCACCLSHRKFIGSLIMLIYVFLVSSILSGSYAFPAPSSMVFLEPSGEGIDRGIPFRAACSKVCLSHLLNHVWLWVSVCSAIHCRQKLFWWWSSKALTYMYNNVFQCHFIAMFCLIFIVFRTWVFYFTIGL